MCKEEEGIKAMSSAAESAAEGEERHNPTEEGAVEVERKPTSVTADAVKYEEKPDLGQRAEEDGADKAALSVTDLAAAAGSGKTESEAAAGAAREGLTSLKVGKLDSDVLQEIVLDRIAYRRSEVKTRAGVGEDCAVIDFGAYDCVISTDPITAAVSEIGRLAIHISCNDIASNGIEPLGITLAVMLPVGTTASDVALIMEQAGEAAAAAGVEIIGGHTEVTPAVNQPVIVSTAFGRAVSGSCQSAEDMRSGDYVLLTKWAGLEGTGIIAEDYEEELSGVLTADELAEAKSLLNDVSVVKEGVAAGRIGTGGMHDVTEGGILGAVWEMCHIAGLGVELWEEAVPVHDVTLKIAAHFDINPLRLISSGCMMIMAAPEKKEALLEAITGAGVPVCCIGQICAKEAGLTLVRCGGQREEITPPEPDELYKVVK